MHLTKVISRPVLTEKSYLGHANGVYTFLVDKRANKQQIKKTFEQLFEVKVDSIKTLNYDGKVKNLSSRSKQHFSVGKTNSYKKAYIKLKAGEKLDILNDL